ncbi:MAG: hypothetical protein ACRCX2_27090 [Paraclostridium sp.]
MEKMFLVNVVYGRRLEQVFEGTIEDAKKHYKQVVDFENLEAEDKEEANEYLETLNKDELIGGEFFGDNCNIVEVTEEEYRECEDYSKEEIEKFFHEYDIKL